MKSSPLLAALAAAGLAACTWQQKAGWGWQDPDRATWTDHVLDKDDVKDDRELRALLGRIASGDLPKIQFDFDSADLRDSSHETLDLVADWLLRHPTRKLRVFAHTCDVGGAEYNLDLSERRALAVKDYLLKRGVPPPSIRHKGMGLTQPLVPNDTEGHRELNRRVEFRLVLRDWDSVY